jgi:1-acyl-sn-glycerol-3-phosphate acyltransferase
LRLTSLSSILPRVVVEARKHPSIERVCAWYGRRLLAKEFARVWLGGTAWPETHAPTIAVLNHSSWWDPLVALFLSRYLFRRDAYGIMQGEQLLRYPFFRRIGYFGATGTGLQDVRALLAYATSTLRSGPRRTLWITPQGALLPARASLVFRSGAAHLARAVPEALVVPVALRYEFRAEQHPECFVRTGEPVRSLNQEPPRVLSQRLEQAVRQELATLDRELLGPVESRYDSVLHGRTSLSQVYDRTWGRWGWGGE